MIDLSPNLSISTLKVGEHNTSIKKRRMYQVYKNARAKSIVFKRNRC